RRRRIKKSGDSDDGRGEKKALLKE
ncbi:hypothetical protein CCACVL1_08146, partial [Corchorus capsularis]